jgi:hypothetical protein
MFRGLSAHAQRTTAAALLAPILCAVSQAQAPADEPPPGAWLKRWIAEEPMGGNWFGARDVLKGWGITPTVLYATDLQASVAGGLRRGEAYAGQLSVEIDANLGKLAGLTGLRFDVSGDWASGTDLSLDIGNTFIVAQYFEGRQVRLSKPSTRGGAGSAARHRVLTAAARRERKKEMTHAMSHPARRDDRRAISRSRDQRGRCQGQGRPSGHVGGRVGGAKRSGRR